MKIPCLPDMKTCWHYDNKIRQYYLLRQAGFPITDSWTFYDKKKALYWADQARYPVIFKLSGGASSSNVLMVDNSRQAKKLIKQMFGKGIFPGKIPMSTTTQKTDFALYKFLHRQKDINISTF